MTARRFAEGTEVTVEKTRSDLERLIVAHGATGFLYGWQDGVWNVSWRSRIRHVRFRIVRPTDDEMEYTAGGKWRNAKQKRAAVEAEARRRWRALLLIVKAKLELVAGGDALFEEEFLAHIALPDGSTVGQWIAPQIEQAYTSGVMPTLVPGTRPALGSGRT